MSNVLSINGTSADQVYQTILKTGVADSDAKLLVSNWLYQGQFRQGRRFAYVTAFPASVPSCLPTPFARTFAHRDWVDGEDLVQAGASADDDGFNARFHRIEADLDALGTRVAQLAECLADMRADLRKMFDEVAAELNRIDSDIAPVRTVSVDPVFTGGFNLGDLVATTAGPVVRPTTLVDDPAYKFLGTTIYQNKQVSLFNSSKGVMILPTVDASVATVTQQAASAGALAQAMHDDADLKVLIGTAVTKDDLVQKFGNVALSNGQTVGQAVSVLPDGAQYSTGQALLDDLAVHSSTVLQATDGAALRLAASVNAPTSATTLGGADVAGLGTLSADATKALKDAGISTIGQLAAADPTKVSTVLSGGASRLSAGQIASVTTTAKTLSKLNIGR